MTDSTQGESFTPDVAPSHTSAMGRIRNYFLTGLVVAGPVLVTLYLTWSFINWVDNIVRPFIPPMYRPETYLPWPIPGTGRDCICRTDVSRFPHRQFCRRQTTGLRRTPAQPHADRAADLQDHEAGFRNAVFQDRIGLPASRLG